MQVWETNEQLSLSEGQTEVQRKGPLPSQPRSTGLVASGMPMLNLLKGTTESYWIHTSPLASMLQNYCSACDLNPILSISKRQKTLWKQRKASRPSRGTPYISKAELRKQTSWRRCLWRIWNWPPIQNRWLVSPEVGKLLPAGQIWPTASFCEVFWNVSTSICLWIVYGCLSFCAKMAE